MPIVSLEALLAGARAGGVVSFPTDTVPALAVLPQRSALIFRAKNRPADKPLILMAAEPADLWPYVRGTAPEWEIWRQVARDYWPGQLTLVLPASDAVPTAMNPTDPETIGLRVPRHRTAREILRRTGPLATTSANLSGEPPLETPAAIARAFPQVLVLEEVEWGSQEKYGSGLPSTVAKWIGKDWKILRQGSIISI